MLNEPGLASTLLKVGHHGSLTSTRPEFLARVAPQWAVISVDCTTVTAIRAPRFLKRFKPETSALFRQTSTAPLVFASTASLSFQIQPVEDKIPDSTTPRQKRRGTGFRPYPNEFTPMFTCSTRAALQGLPHSEDRPSPDRLKLLNENAYQSAPSCGARVLPNPLSGIAPLPLDTMTALSRAHRVLPTCLQWEGASLPGRTFRRRNRSPLLPACAIPLLAAIHSTRAPTHGKASICDRVERSSIDRG